MFNFCHAEKSGNDWIEARHKAGQASDDLIRVVCDFQLRVTTVSQVSVAKMSGASKIQAKDVALKSRHLEFIHDRKRIKHKKDEIF